jgi:hypothetical protein
VNALLMPIDCSEALTDSFASEYIAHEWFIVSELVLSEHVYQ